MTRGHFIVTLVLQSCTYSLQVLPGSSCETFPASSDVTYDVGNIKFDIDIEEVEEEEEVNMKTEKVVGSEEGKCIDIKEEQGLHSEEEDEEEENMDIQEEESIEIKEEVRMRIQCSF